MNQHSFDMYYDNPSNRSPTSQRQQGSLNRQSSRQQFDAAYGHLPSGLYTAEDYRQDPARYGDARNATIGGYGGGYDMGGQSWNAGGSFGGNNTVNGFGGPPMRKPGSRGRTGIPNVRLAHTPQSPDPHR